MQQKSISKGKYVFVQLTEFLPRRVFGQLTSSDSMRDLMFSLQAHRPKYYHLGFGTTVTRRNLGEANEKRNKRIFEGFAIVLIGEARKSCYRDDFEIDLKGHEYTLDPTTRLAGRQAMIQSINIKTSFQPGANKIDTKTQIPNSKAFRNDDTAGCVGFS